MNYQKIYKSLIDRGLNRDPLSGYTEKHHIIPKCMGGSDNNDNLVSLTPEEHYLAHQLLTKIYPDEHKLIYAVKMMCVSSEYTIRNNKEFGWIRNRYYIANSGVNAPNYGKVFSDETKKKMSVSMTGSRVMPKEQKDRMSLGRMKDGKPFYGKTHSDETKKKISNSSKGILKKKLSMGICPHCDFETSNYSVRHHFDNCKHKGVDKIEKTEVSYNDGIAICPHCNKHGKWNMRRYHFDNCKMRILK